LALFSIIVCMNVFFFPSLSFLERKSEKVFVYRKLVTALFASSILSLSISIFNEKKDFGQPELDLSLSF
jgi:hypothetical protein